MRRQLNSTVHRRMNVLLLDDGWAAERIAEALYIDAETVREHRRLYETAGVSGLERLAYVGAAPDLTSEQCAKLTAELERRLYMTSKEVCAFVASGFGVEYTPNAMSKLLKRLGFVYKKPKRVPAKADAAVQRQFVEQTLAPLMAEAGAEKPLYFSDASHPAYTGHPACGAMGFVVMRWPRQAHWGTPNLEGCGGSLGSSKFPSMSEGVFTVAGRRFLALRKAGRRAGLPVYHAVTPSCRMALCATEPGAGSRWAELADEDVSCQACLDRLTRLQRRELSRDTCEQLLGGWVR